jgi:cellulose synthase/poly-beta-1,6-N-acetylglucosamine synthase-like glycosyltransferase
MCFSAEVIKKFGWNAFSIAENWEYYAILTLSDYMVVHEDSAIIYSQVANTLKEGKTQRVRWLRGRIDTLHRYWKQLLKKTLVKRKLIYLDAAIELLRPSHSILFFWSFMYLTLCSIGWYYFSFDLWIFVGSTSIFSSLVFIFILGLVVQRAPLKTWLSLGMVPIYLIWKFIVTIKGLLSLNDNKWIRTKRN